VLFPDVANETQVTVTLPNAITKVRGLWFEAGTWTTLTGPSTGSLTIGETLPVYGNAITVNSNYTAQSETNINIKVWIAGTAGTTRVITNQSEGGLRFGGDVDFGDRNLVIAGSRATHFNGKLIGSGSITVTTGENDNPTHLVLQTTANNFAPPPWSGALTAHNQAMVITRTISNVGTGTITAQSGGTIAWRNSLSNATSQYNATTQVMIKGQGVVRQTGIEPVGAIYSDGGLIRIYNGITFEGNTWLGARSGLNDVLHLVGEINAQGYDFVKVGPGLLVLQLPYNPNNPWGANAWGRMIIRGGLINTMSTLPSGNIILDGGMLSANIIRNLGPGPDQIQWQGDGGFAGRPDAYTLNGGAALTWGQQYFVGDGHALLLGSKHAGFNTNFTNDIDLGVSPIGQHREVRVEPSRNFLYANWAKIDPDAHAILSGKITSSDYTVIYDNDGNFADIIMPTTGLLKTGRGLLKLSNPMEQNMQGLFNSLWPAVIREGALLLARYGDGGGTSPWQPVQLDGGILGLNGGTSRSLGTGRGQIRWTNSGGFAAYDNTLWTLVVIGEDSSNPDLLEWGVTPHFLANGQELRFGHYTATGTILWRNDIELGLATRTIRVERGRDLNRADVEVWGNISSPNKAILEVVGDGRLDFVKPINSLRISHLRIKGAEVRLSRETYLAAADIITEISHGGMLTLDTMGSNLPEIIHSQVRINLNAGNLQHRSNMIGESYESSNLFTLLGGANSIHLHKFDELESFVPDMRYTIMSFIQGHRSATFNATNNNKTFATTDAVNNVRLQVDNGASLEIGGLAAHKVIPWMTVGGTDFAKTATSDGNTYIVAVNNYSGSYNTLDSNVRQSANTTVTLNSDKTINSLKLSGGTLALGTKQLTLNSGGLLSLGDRTITGTQSGNVTGRIRTPNGRPLYLHVYGENGGAGGRLTFSGDVMIRGWVDVVKTGPGQLILNSSLTHEIGSLYINQGMVSLGNDTSLRLGNNKRIYVGDGAGIDILQLAPNRWDQITRTNGLPAITLHGTPYSPHGPEYHSYTFNDPIGIGTPQAILRMGGNTKLHLSNLHIESRGTIDWVGGEVGLANILWLDTLTFSGPDAILFMRNWYEYEDFLLVRSNGFDLSYLQNVRFEGYENFPVLWRKYNENYYQITPFGSQIPEPSTYGAIVGTLGLGLWAWRRRKQRRVASTAHARGHFGARNILFPASAGAGRSGVGQCQTPSKSAAASTSAWGVCG